MYGRDIKKDPFCKKNIINELNASAGDLIFMLAGPKLKTLTNMGSLRLEMADRLNLIKPDSEPALLWVTGFPLLEWDDGTKRYYAMHHPFTSPNLDEIDLLDTEPENVHADTLLGSSPQELGGDTYRKT